VWAACGAEEARGNVVGSAFKLMMLTGQTRGEVLRMRWPDISEESRAQGLRVAGGCLTQALDGAPYRHGVHLDAQELSGHLGREGIGGHAPQEAKHPSEQAAGLARLHLERLQHRAAFGTAGRTAVTTNPHPYRPTQVSQPVERRS